jgi:hypothetical protein
MSNTHLRADIFQILDAEFPFDSLYHDDIWSPTPQQAEQLTSLILTKFPNIRQGDIVVVRFSFTNRTPKMFLMYDGTQMLLADTEIPEVFVVPMQYPPRYWLTGGDDGGMASLKNVIGRMFQRERYAIYIPRDRPYTAEDLYVGADTGSVQLVCPIRVTGQNYYLVGVDTETPHSLEANVTVFLDMLNHCREQPTYVYMFNRDTHYKDRISRAVVYTPIPSVSKDDVIPMMIAHDD